MKKVILLIMFSICLSACNPGKEGRTNTISNASSQEKKIKIELKDKEDSWKKDISFDKCDSILNYKSRAEWLQSKEVKLLSEKSKNVQANVEDRFPFKDRFPFIIQEYCKSKSWLYILYAQDKMPRHFARYDKNTDKFEVAKMKLSTSDHIPFFFFHWKNNFDTTRYLIKYQKDNEKSSWFGKRNWDIVKFSVHWIRPHRLLYEKVIPKDKSKRCRNMLTPKWNPTVCFVNIFYDYNFKKNIIYEKKACSYAFNDNWSIFSLWECVLSDQEK